MANKYFTVYWQNGDKQYIHGETAEDAFNTSGIGRGALSVVDFFADGLDFGYGWNAVEKKWVKTEPAVYVNLFDMAVAGVGFRSFHINFLEPTFKEKGIFFDHQNDTSCVVYTADLEKIWNIKFW